MMQYNNNLMQLSPVGFGETCSTPLPRSLRTTPFASAKALPPFSPLPEALPSRSGRRMSSPLQLDARMLEVLRHEGERREEKGEQSKWLQGLLSPSHLNKLNPRISFSYRPPTLANARSQLTTLPHRPTRQQLQRRKAERCRLSSNEFCFAYVPPKRNIDDCAYTLTRSIRSIPLEEDCHLTRRTVCESKVASTTASSGFPLHLKASDLSLPAGRQNNSEIGCGRGLEGLAGKQLGRTVMLGGYSFGGLMGLGEGGPMGLGEGGLGGERAVESELSSRAWRNHFALLSSGGGDMKESIHCGPELRNEHRFEMLGGYGREIKESTTSFCD